MRNLKKILALVLALMMALSVMVFASAKNLEDYTDAADVSEDYAEAVDVLTGMGIFEGDEEGFRPQDNITRAEVAALVYRVLTGDVNNVNVGLYEDYGYFTDVPADEWYAGYVNFVANGKHVVGVADGIYDPDANVTGYQMLTIMLRAIGYGQKEEFEGDSWTIHVAQYAERLGLTNGLDTTLSAQLTREEVAYIIWQAIRENMVEWTPAFGYQPIWIEADDNNGVQLTTTTLGWESFGLDDYAGYVVGNQATGEDGTIVNKNYTSAAANGGVPLNVETGLDQFGHQLTGWYCAEDTTYTDEGTVFSMADNSTAQVMTTDELTEAINDAVVDVDAYSTDFGNFGTTTFTNDYDYNVVVTTGNTDAVIKVWIETAQYTAINNQAATKTVTLTNVQGAFSPDTISQAFVSGYEDLSLGTLVNVVKVEGTSGASATVYPHYEVSALGTVSGRVSKVDDGVITVNGTEIDPSTDNQINIAGGVGLTVPNRWNTDETAGYVVYTNLFGDYVGAVPMSNLSYAKLVYAYYEGSASAGTLTYYGDIVRNDGAIERGVVLALTEDEYNALSCSMWDLRTNTLTEGTPMDVVLVPTTSGYDIAHAVSTEWSVMGTGYDNVRSPHALLVNKLQATNMDTVRHVRGESGAWSVSANTTTVGTNKNYVVDGTTRFVVISGYGDAMEVTTYTGVADLLQGNASATIAGTSIVTFTQVYTANIGSYNYHVDYVLIEEDDLTRVPVSNLIYIEDATSVAYDSTGDLYDVYIDGVSYQLPVDDSSCAASDETFYSYRLVNGVYVLRAEVDTLNATVSGALDDYALTNSEGTNEYLYVYGTYTPAGGGATQVQLTIDADATVINLEPAACTINNVADLIAGVQNANITVDIEVVNGEVVNVYVVGYVPT